MVNVWMDDVMAYDIRELSSVVSLKLGIVAVGKIVQPEREREDTRGVVMLDLYTPLPAREEGNSGAAAPPPHINVSIHLEHVSPKVVRVRACSLGRSECRTHCCRRLT